MDSSDSPNSRRAHPAGAAPGAPSGEATTLSLRALLADEATAIAALAAPADTDRPVLGVEFHDADDDGSIAEGVLLLVPSWRALGPEALARLRDLAARRRAAGIAVQGGRDDEIAAALGADRPGAAPLLRIADGLTWREVEALVERAIGEHAPGITASVLQPDHLFAIADSIAEVFGGSVAVEDHARILLAYSTVPGQVIDEFRAEGIRTRKVPEAAMNSEQYREVLRADGPVRFPRYGDELPRAAIAIRAGGLQLGSIWAIDPDGADPAAPLPPERLEALERGARAAAAHLVAAWRATDAETRRREAALVRLLAGPPEGDELATLGLSQRAEARLVAVGFAGEGGGPGDLRQLLAFAERRLRARVAVAGGAVDAGVGCIAVEGASAERLRDAVAVALRAASRAFTIPVRAALAGPARVADGLAAARAEADAILRLPHDPRRPVRASGDVRAALLAQRLADLLDAHPHLRHPALAAPPGGRRERERRETLLAWFEQGGASGAAAVLGVHENTVRYRVQQAVDEWRLRLDEPDEAFALQAALIADRARERAG